MNENDNVSKLCSDYKNALLCGQQGKIDKIRPILCQELEDVDVFFAEADKWNQTSQNLIRQAVEAAQNGETRSGIGFENLTEEAKKLGGNVKGLLCQKFDDAVTEFQKKKTVSCISSNRSVYSNYNNDNRRLSVFEKKKNDLLKEIQKFASWNDDYQKKLEDKCDEFLSCFPNDEEEMNQAIDRGKLLKQSWNKAYKWGCENRPESDIFPLIDQLEQKGIAKDLLEKVWDQYDKGKICRQRGESSKDYKSTLPTAGRQFESYQTSIPKISNESEKKMTLTGIHPNALSQQRPSAEWTVLIDETGKEFSDRVYTSKQKEIGRIVGVFVSQETELPELPVGFHACNEPTNEPLEKIIRSLIELECGVLGVSVNGFSRVQVEQWYDGIGFLLDLALRLLPIDGETRFNIFVEQRGENNSSKSYLLQKTCDDVLYRFRRLRPDLAEKIILNGKLISKTGHKYNGYVDTAAFVWGGSSAKNLLKASGWENTCFLGDSDYSLCDIMDIMEREGTISPEQWTTLITCPEAQSQNSFVSSLLRQLGGWTRENVEKWRSYMNYTLQHIDSKAVNMQTLGQQINWLKEYEPDDEKLLPRLRLLWLTIQLANENHQGKITADEKHIQEFLNLADQLFEEDAPLVCTAMLHFAVEQTNEFDFEGAQKTLANWYDVPAAVPGLQLYGRILSSLGQHEAFLGDNIKAIDYFRKAIEKFGKLSNPQEAFRDMLQTRTYLLIALMDAETSCQAELNKELLQYFDKTPEEAAKELSISIADNDNYAHYLLLRYLTLNADSINADSADSDISKEDSVGVKTSAIEKATENYLSNRSDWKTGNGHPWELIEFYRGLLLSDETARKEQFRNAYEISRHEGLTVQAIGAVILGSLLLLDESVLPEYENLVNTLRTELPYFGTRADILAEQPFCKRSPLELAAAVLPFNFR